MTQQGQYVDKKQLAEILQVSEVTIDRWRKKGLPWTRMGVKLVRFDLDKVNEWLASNADQSYTPAALKK